jgi:molecular chaperone GrpE (heat shock protein)
MAEAKPGRWMAEAKRYRAEARRLREEAEQAATLDFRRRILAIADQYDRLARMVEEQAAIRSANPTVKTSDG